MSIDIVGVIGSSPTNPTSERHPLWVVFLCGLRDVEPWSPRSWGDCSRAHPVGETARRRPNEQRVITNVSEDRTLLRIVDIGSSPTNPTRSQP